MLRDLTEEIKRLQAEQSSVEEAGRFLTDFGRAVDSVRFPTTAPDLLTEVKQAVGEIMGLPLSVDINDETDEVSALTGAVEMLSEVDLLPESPSPSDYRLSEDVMRILSPIGRTSRVGTTSRFIVEEISIDATGALPAVKELIDAIPVTYSHDPKSKKRQDLETLLTAAQNEVKDMTPTQLMAKLTPLLEKERTRMKEVIGKVAASIETRKKTLENEMAAKRDAYMMLDKVIGEQEEKKSATVSLDRTLFWAIPLMIVMLGLMFISLKLFAPDIATDVIAERTLVEVISIAFLLLTVIILGIGDRLQSEALGTLLGTVAGYVFGRRAVEAGTHRTPRTTNGRERELGPDVAPVGG